MATPRAPHEHGRIRRPSPLSECGSAVTLTLHPPAGRPDRARSGSRGGRDEARLPAFAAPYGGDEAARPRHGTSPTCSASSGTRASRPPGSMPKRRLPYCGANSIRSPPRPPMPWSRPSSIGMGTRRPCWRPSCSWGIASSGSALLMHDLPMLAATQAGVDRSPGERNARPALAPLCARQSLLERPVRVGVVEDLGPSFKHGLFDDVGHGVDVLESIQRTPSIASDVVAGRTATVLRRAGGMAGHAGRIGLTGDRLKPGLEPDLVAPGDVQVVLVGEPGARTQAQALQGHIRRGR